MSYWDTSALGKLYLPEPDSADYSQKAALDPAIATTRLALFEMRRVAFRKESEGFIQAGTAESVLTLVNNDIAAGQIRIVELDLRVEAEFNAIMATCYRHAPPVPLLVLWMPYTWRQLVLTTKSNWSPLISGCARLRNF